jgi:nitrate/nitrite transporter NarK
MSYIYIGTFGSFIGYSAAFPLLIKTQFPAVTVGIAFLGPLVGSLSRPLGGLLADKVGGAIVTFWNFIAMAAATIGVMYFVEAKDFIGFLAMFLVLFVTTGVGNGSTYRMIPSIFREEKLREAKGSGEADRALAVSAARIESAAALGFIGAVGAGRAWRICALSHPNSGLPEFGTLRVGRSRMNPTSAAGEGMKVAQRTVMGEGVASQRVARTPLTLHLR